MNILKETFANFSLFWKFLGIFQNPFLRVWHVLAIVFVLLQFLIFFDISFTNNSHIERGLFLVPFVCVFWFMSIKRRGVKYFFAYLWGDMTQLKKDIQHIRERKMPPPKAGGLAGTIQGFGLLFFFLTVFFGFLLYLSWEGFVDYDFYTLHDLCASLLLLYFIVHAAYSLRHFYFWKKTVVKK